MAQKENPILRQTFNIFDTGREYTGIQRNYLLENAKKIIYDPATRERLRLRQLYGYFGHTFRELAGKLTLSAKNVLTLSNGQQIIADAEPNSVCVDLEMDDDGNVTHSQEVFINTDGGKSIMAMNSNKVGGWSWACAPGGMTPSGNTLISSIHGFDYDPNPLFVNNKAWVMDSDNGSADIPSKSQLLKSLKDFGVEKPGTVLDSWYASLSLANNAYQEQVAGYEIMLLDANEEKAAILEEKEGLQQVNDALTERVTGLEQQITDAEEAQQQALSEQARSHQQVLDAWEEEKAAEIQQINDAHSSAITALNQEHAASTQSAQDDRKAMFKEFQAKSSVSIPDAVLDALTNPTGVDVLEPFNEWISQVAKIQGGTLPLGQKPKAEYVRQKPLVLDSDSMGTIGIIPDMAM